MTDEELEKIREDKIQQIKEKSKKPAKPVKATSETLGGLLQKHTLVLADFWAPWCAPCKMIAPILEEIAEKYQGQLAVAKINVDENPQIAKHMKIMSIPTLILFKEGETAERITGMQEKHALEQKIQKHLE